MNLKLAGRNQVGFNLVELMVASTIGMLIMLAILTLYLNISRTNEDMSRTNALIENGRFAIKILQGDLAHAGFWGGYVPEFDDFTKDEMEPVGYPPPSPLPSPLPESEEVPGLCEPYASWGSNDYRNRLLATPVQVYSAVPPGCAENNASVAAGRYTYTVSGSPGFSVDPAVIAVRYAETCIAEVGSASCPLNLDGSLYLQVSHCPEGTSAVSTVVEDDDAYLLTDPDAVEDLTLKNMKCSVVPALAASETRAPVRRYVSNVYYVRSYSSVAGDGIPTLVRNRFELKDDVLQYQGAESLVEGVEDLRIELGIDNLSKTNAAVDYEEALDWADDLSKTTATNRGDGVADEFVTCPADGCTALQLVGAVSARIHVLVRSPQATPGYTDTKKYHLGAVTVGPFGDGFKRHVFSGFIRFNNISMRREAP